MTAEHTPDSDRTAEIRALVGALDDDADMLHNDVTPAVRRLPDYGVAVIPHLREALLSESWDTRLHAQGVLATIIGRSCADAKALWADNGAYDADADVDARRRSVDAWMAWHAEQLAGEEG